MKKLLCAVLAALLLLTLAACSETGKPAKTDPPVGTGSPDVLIEPRGAKLFPSVTNGSEGVLYDNIFFNNMADDYVGKTITKEGTYTRLYDAFSQKYRYYVWGYRDNTKCTDWQWEFVPADPEALPPVGSLVKMTGTLTRDDAALDKLWFTNTAIEVEQSFNPPACDVNMTVMGTTLERVQLLNMQYKPEAFEGQSLRVYGRVMNSFTIQHPCYDNVWSQEFSTDKEVPGIGNIIILAGTWQSSIIQVDNLEITKDY